MNPFQVVIIGSGFGGQCAAIKLRDMGIENFVILERNSVAGGTWIQNTYPGAAVDVQSPLYSLSMEPYDWSQLYCDREELAAYTTHVIEKNGLVAMIRLDTCVTGLTWDEESGTWLIGTDNGAELRSRFVINATGPLSTPMMPTLVGHELYQGKSFHSNNWDHDFDLREKRVAIIGSGASAAQIIPAIAPLVQKLHVFQRTPHWVMKRPDYQFKPWQRRLLKYRFFSKLLRAVIYCTLETRVIGFKYSPFLLRLIAQGSALRHLRKQIKDPQLREALTPDYAIGCKRIILSNELYPTLQKPNVELHTQEDGISSLTKEGIHTSSGTNLELDLIVYATGFDAVENPVQYPITGRDGVSLKEFWREFPRAYLGSSVPAFPNLFLVYGPNTGVGHTSAIYIIEAQMEYVVRAIASVIESKKKCVEVTSDAEDTYTKKIHKALSGTVWVLGGCNSWYRNINGRVIAIFPGFTFTLMRWARKFRVRDHVYR